MDGSDAVAPLLLSSRHSSPNALETYCQRFTISLDGTLAIVARLGPGESLEEVILPELPTQSFPSVCPARFRATLDQLQTFPLAPARDAQQQRFREALLSIPIGQTRTYGELARTLDSSPRGIGARCASNPLLLRIPCHRVVSVRNLSGYRAGVLWKQWLLELERASAGIQPLP